MEDYVICRKNGSKVKFSENGKTTSYSENRSQYKCVGERQNKLNILTNRRQIKIAHLLLKNFLGLVYN